MDRRQTGVFRHIVDFLGAQIFGASTREKQIVVAFAHNFAFGRGVAVRVCSRGGELFGAQAVPFLKARGLAARRFRDGVARFIVLSALAVENRGVRFFVAVFVKRSVVKLDAFFDDEARLDLPETLFDAHLFLFQHFVIFKELLQFVQSVRRQFRDIAVMAKRRIVFVNRDDFVVFFVLVDHLHHADRARRQQAHRLHRFLAQNENIERVLVVAVSTRDEAVIRRIKDGGIQNAVEAQHSGFLVEFVFLVAATRDFDQAIDGFGRVFAGINSVPGMHNHSGAKFSRMQSAFRPREYSRFVVCQSRGVNGKMRAMRSIIPKGARADNAVDGNGDDNRTRWESNAARYDVLQRVGESTLFVTYRVRDKKDGRVVALKALKGSFARHQLFASTLAQVMQAQIAFSHPNLATVYEVGDEESTPFIVGQWLPGQSLESRLRRAPLGTYETRLILGQLLEGLAYLHERNLAHGDLRPRQVGADSDGTLKINDAGVHRALAAAGMSQVDLFADAVYYQAPECADNAPASFSSDLYSLGVMLYRMLAGRLPYDGPSPLSIALRHRRDAPMPPSQFNPDCAPQLEKIALKLLQKTPQTRYASAREVLAELNDATENNAPNAAVSAPVSVAPDSSVVIAAGAASAVAVGAAAIGATAMGAATVGASAVAGNAAAGIAAPIAATSAATLFAGGDAATQPLPVKSNAAIPANAASTRGAADDDEPDDADAFSTDSDAYRAAAKKQRRREAWGAFFALFWFVVATGLFGGLFYGSYVYLQNDTPREVAVPAYIGKSEDEARRMLEKQDLTLVVTSQRYDPKKPAGTVLDGQPVPGHVVRIGREVNVTVSRGEEPTTMPDFSEMSLPRAREIIQKAGMKLGAIADQYHDTIPKGYICGQYPEPGQSVSRSEPLNLIVSRGSQQLEALQSQTDDTADNGPGEEDYLPDPSAAATPGDVPMVSRVVQVRVTVPARGGNREVRIVVRDGNGENTVYQRTHAPGELVEEYIKVTRPQRGDKALIRVFLDDKLLQEQKV